MRRVIPFVLLGLLALVPIGKTSPVQGTNAKSQNVGAAPWTMTQSFRGGERACVIAFSLKHEPVVKLHLAVYDAKGNLVTEDKARNSLVGDHVCVIWYPPRTAEYKVELRTQADGEVECYMSIK